MSSSFKMDASTAMATALLCLSALWTTFPVYDVPRRPDPPTLLRMVGVLCHNIPAMFLLSTAIAAQSIDDTALAWFVALLAFRYWRTLVNIYFWCQYKPTVATAALKFGPESCTVVVPTVVPFGNKVYGEMIAAIIVNRPSRLIFSTNTASAAQLVEDALPAIFLK
jgi:hypothetical protein